MGNAKRKRQRANKQARFEAEHPLPELSDLDLESLLVEVTVRDDCEHASTRTIGTAQVLTRCAVQADVAGGCPLDCERFEKRRIGGIGMGLGAGA